MTLKRFTNEELQDLCEVIIIQELITSNKKNSAMLIEDFQLDIKKEEQDTLSELKKAIEEKFDINNTFYKEDRILYNKKLSSLGKRLNEISRVNNIKDKKELYKSKKDEITFNNTHTIFSIPLRGKLNSLYDDVVLEVAMYDNFAQVDSNKIDKLKSMQDIKDKYNYVKENIEITNINLYVERFNIKLPLKGEDTPYYGKEGKRILPLTLAKKLCNFNDMTLKDCNSIENMDVRQYFTSKIDMDKELKTKVSSLYIRGDLYELYEIFNEYYISFTCPSTKRVYYEIIDTGHLSKSKFYTEEIESIIPAWWNISSCGNDPYIKLNIIRC